MNEKKIIEVLVQLNNTMNRLDERISALESQSKLESPEEVKRVTLKPTATAVAKKPVYTRCEDGKSVVVGGNGFIPKKVFFGVTCSLKEYGAKWDKTAKVWTFDTKKACTEWCKAQDARNKAE